MKKHSFIYTTIAVLAMTRPVDAAPHMVYANSLGAHNIAAIQHSVINTAFQSFETPAGLVRSDSRNVVAQPTPAPTPRPQQTYQHVKYGTMPMYGEYGDDGTVFGRSGGDTTAHVPSPRNIWGAWRHYDEDMKLGHIDKSDVKYDLVMAGTSIGAAQISDGISEWGVYAGYVGGNLKNEGITTDNNGGYFGIYNQYLLGDFSLSTSINAGAINNNNQHLAGDNEFTNMWVGGAMQIAYRIAIDDIFALQPMLYAGYTWINSPNYIAHGTGISIANQNFNMFEVSPGIRAAAHIANGWFASANAKYIANFAASGQVWENGTRMQELSTRNYIEYGLGIEKSIDNFTLAAHLGRHDLGRTGWTGGLNLKYLF